MDLYDEFCKKLCSKLRDYLKDTYVSVSYIRSSDLLEIYVRHGELKFGYNVQNLSRHILYGYGTEQIINDFMKEWKQRIYDSFFKKKKKD